jgi:hypothetical protein
MGLGVAVEREKSVGRVFGDGPICFQETGNQAGRVFSGEKNLWFDN